MFHRVMDGATEARDKEEVLDQGLNMQRDEI